MYEVAIIGLGGAGSTLFDSLPPTISTLILEKGSIAIPPSSTTSNQCFKLHTGMHYLGDQSTAEKCLVNAIEFAKKYPQIICGGDDLRSPWRRGRHFILSESQVSPERADKIAHFLKDRYSELVEMDHSNQVFGKPDEFIQQIPPEQYEYIAKKIPITRENGSQTYASIVCAYETAESQISIEMLRSHVMMQIKNRPNTSFIPNTNVISISPHPTKVGYIITAENQDGRQVQYETKTVFSCTWVAEKQFESKKNQFEFDHDLSPIPLENEQEVARIKASVVIKLPVELQSMNTCIFSCGPFCSMTIFPDGKAILTSEPTTNIDYFKTENSNPCSMQNQLDTLKLSHPIGCEIATRIKRECSDYLIPEMADLLNKAEILDLQIGHVLIDEAKKKYTEKSIYDSSSVIHSRQKDGIRCQDLGFFSNRLMKMTYAVGNARKAIQLLEKHLVWIEQLNTLIQKVTQHFLPNERNYEQILLSQHRQQMIDTIQSGQYEKNPEKCTLLFIKLLDESTPSKMLNNTLSKRTAYTGLEKNELLNAEDITQEFKKNKVK